MAFKTQTQDFILWKLETCWPWDHAMICRAIIQTIPRSPFLLAQIKNQPPHPPQHSLNTFSPYLLQPLRWMQTSLETLATETTERRRKTPKTRSTWTMNHHESSKLGHNTDVMIWIDKVNFNYCHYFVEHLTYICSFYVVTMDDKFIKKTPQGTILYFL